MGLPIEANPRSKALWDPVVEKFEKILSMWKRQCLSLGGRITLIKATLSNLPIYYMSIFKMPRLVLDKLDHLRRSFLWKGRSDKRKLHLMKWSEAVKPKYAGGAWLPSVEELGIVD